MKTAKQQIHKRCLGTIIVVSYKDEIMFACNKCAERFSYNIELPKHEGWRDINKRDGCDIIINKTGGNN